MKWTIPSLQTSSKYALLGLCRASAQKSAIAMAKTITIRISLDVVDCSLLTWFL